MIPNITFIYIFKSYQFIINITMIYLQRETGLDIMADDTDTDLTANKVKR